MDLPMRLGSRQGGMDEFSPQKHSMIHHSKEEMAQQIMRTGPHRMYLKLLSQMIGEGSPLGRKWLDQALHYLVSGGCLSFLSNM